MAEEYYDFSKWPEGADMVKEMLDFLPDDDTVRTNYLEAFATALTAL